MCARFLLLQRCLLLNTRHYLYKISDACLTFGAIITNRLRLARVFRRRERRDSRSFRERPSNCRWGQNASADFRVSKDCCETTAVDIFFFVSFS